MTSVLSARAVTTIAGVVETRRISRHTSMRSSSSMISTDSHVPGTAQH
jgi:hypothetical protein